MCAWPPQGKRWPQCGAWVMSGQLCEGLPGVAQLTCKEDREEYHTKQNFYYEILYCYMLSQFKMSHENYSIMLLLLTYFLASLIEF